MTHPGSPYPVRVDASLDAPLSRWLWLVKWLLILPHVVVLVFLWLAFAVLSVVALVAILFTGRYPRGIFDFNLGVLRWTWRVQYYSYAALGTDRYPPFTLQEVPDYPAQLHVDYPERLSRGLVLVKWWLLVLPHYLIVGLFVGGGTWFLWQRGSENASWAAGGLVGVLVLIAGIVLTFTGRYPRPVYDFVLGMDRWVLRVAAYAGLMTDRYPPFRLDMGGTDPDSVPAGSVPIPPTDAAAQAGSSRPQPSAEAPAATRPAAVHSWTGGRIVAVVAGAVLLFMATGLLVGGAGLLWADQTQREDGYLSSPSSTYGTEGYALISDQVELETAGYQWAVDDVLGTARLQVSPTDLGGDLFVGVARTADVRNYLRGVAHRQVGDLGRAGSEMGQMGPGTMTDRPGGPPASPPQSMDIWVAQSSGAGLRTVEWTPADGDWTVVVMRADGGPGVTAQVRAGVTAPGLPWLAGGLLAGGGVLLIIGAFLITVAVRRAGASPPRPIAGPAQPPPPTTPAHPGAAAQPALSSTGGPR